ncbi:prepilin-type N-terminal cleavage/methylation domain-containing protein [Patescibacteria group bacterium]|nr:prepilin-type N-terminal cleavage/methylation domain-containing protein [Patescibacteria group bacterium]
MYKNKEKGFTLIELLVVIAIIGILSSVVLASLNSARLKARDAKRVSDLKQLQLALEMFYDDNSAYPVSTTYAGISALTTNLVNSGYIAAMPIDPSSNSFGYIGTATTYCLSTAVEGNVPDGSSSCTAQVTSPVANYSVSP